MEGKLSNYLNSGEVEKHIKRARRYINTILKDKNMETIDKYGYLLALKGCIDLVFSKQEEVSDEQ